MAVSYYNFYILNPNSKRVQTHEFVTPDVHRLLVYLRQLLEKYTQKFFVSHPEKCYQVNCPYEIKYLQFNICLFISIFI